LDSKRLAFTKFYATTLQEGFMTDKQPLVFENAAYDQDALSNDVKRNLADIQNANNEITRLSSVIRTLQAGSESILMNTRKLLPAPMTPQEVDAWNASQQAAGDAVNAPLQQPEAPKEIEQELEDATVIDETMTH
tara:strand:- start:356 stop:760 length:405 start_codon:yes stop_codon:yes gene_type:complete